MSASTFPNYDIGPLQGLLGHWRGKGRDVAFLPGGVKVESEYLEESLITAAPVMRLSHTKYVHAAAYESKLVDANSGEPLHHESGYWAWVPDVKKALRIIALGRALGVVASCDVVSWPAIAFPRLKFDATIATSPSSIATVILGPDVPVMEEFNCVVEISGNTLTYSQVTRVRFGPGATLEHTDAAVLWRQP